MDYGAATFLTVVELMRTIRTVNCSNWEENREIKCWNQNWKVNS